jgi:hypothetical protein
VTLPELEAGLAELKEEVALLQRKFHLSPAKHTQVAQVRCPCCKTTECLCGPKCPCGAMLLCECCKHCGGCCDCPTEKKP